MTRLHCQHQNISAQQLASYLKARDDWAVKEKPDDSTGQAAECDSTGQAAECDSTEQAAEYHSTGQCLFVLAHGPFSYWSRKVSWSRSSAVPTRYDLEEVIDYRLSSPILHILLGPIFKRSLHTRTDSDKAPFWVPPGRFSQRQFHVFTLLISATLLAAFLGTLLSQTMTYVADEFRETTSTQGNVIALTRLGAVFALLMVQLADRKGRRLILLITGTVACVFTVLTAASTSIWVFALAQTFARGASTAFSLLIGIVASEECPRRSRAWMVSVLTLFAGLGSGMVVWFLPLIARTTRGWRVLYLAAGLGFFIIFGLAKRLSETRRFQNYVESAVPAPLTVSMIKRFVLLAVVAFATAAFSAPASNFLNEFLKTERQFSAVQITLFAVVTNTPIGLGVAFFGPLADRRGRRKLAIMGIWAGVLFTVARFSFAGTAMWVAALAATVLGSAVIPALGVYGPELFPTSRRALANGLLTMVGVTGSALGLITAGYAIEKYGYSTTFALLAVVPLLASLAVLSYPETAGKSLEEINPEDR